MRFELHTFLRFQMEDLHQVVAVQDLDPGDSLYLLKLLHNLPYLLPMPNNIIYIYYSIIYKYSYFINIISKNNYILI